METLITTSDVEKIYTMVLLNKPLNLSNFPAYAREQAKELYEQIKSEVAAARKRGVTKFHIPSNGGE